RDVFRWVDVRNVVVAKCRCHLPGQWQRHVRIGDPPRLVLLVESWVGGAARPNLAEACGVESNVESADRVIERRAEGGVGLAFLDPRAFQPVEQNSVLSGKRWWCAVDMGHDGHRMVVSAGEAGDATCAKIERVSGDDVEPVSPGIDGVGEIPSAADAGESL